MFQHQFDAKQIEAALPDYKYIKRLGSGAFAVVHLVEKRDTGEQVALKKVACFGLGEYEKTGAANQARILSSLDHKNIIKVKSCIFDNTEDILYIFMEYAESGDLTLLVDQAKQKKKRIPESTIWKVISDVADGLHYLHRSQIIHRDLKPANIFRMGKSFKIGDMNVSKIIKQGAVASTKTGSPLYSAPEVWNSEQYFEKCDVWSLGALVYELCTLKVPFEADSIIKLLNKIQNQKPKSIPTFYSSQLDKLISRMLQKDPQKRIAAEQISKIASQKLKLQTQGLDEDGVQNLMQTIVFPDTHQRWINLIPCPLPPKTNRNEVLAKSQVQQRGTKSNSKQQNDDSKDLKGNSSTIFRSSQKRPPLNIPKSSSRNKGQQKKQIKQLRVPNVVNLLPPLHRSGSPIANRKKSEEQKKSKQKSIQRRQRSNSRTRRQSASELVSETKSQLRLSGENF